LSFVCIFKYSKVFILNYSIYNKSCLLVFIFFVLFSYASGTKPWKNGESGFERQSYSDGKLEIVGFHTADFVKIFNSKKEKRSFNFISNFLFVFFFKDVITNGWSW
jgi:hypothetical protein